MPIKMLDEITYTFPNVNGTTFEVSEKISNFISHIIMAAITWPGWDQSETIWVKGATGKRRQTYGLAVASLKDTARYNDTFSSSSNGCQAGILQPYI